MAEPRNYCDEALASVGIKPNSGEGFDNSTAKQPKHADILVGLATTGCELFHDPDDIAYADITISGHRETWPVRRKGFKSWLAKRFYDATGGAPSSEAMQTALAVIEAKAVFEGDEHDISVRVGAHNDRVYVDLRDDRWRAIEISADGWRIVDEPPVRFCRTGGMRPLPEPQRGGSIDTLRPLINVKDDRDFLLVIAWLLAALRPRGPYPILAPIGEAGTTKSTLARILRALVDPNKAPLRSLSRDDRELFISAVNMWVLSFDNVSVLPRWLSDGLCRLATGGGHAARSLYTNSEEALFDAMRPIVLNGIENFIVRGDLADRALVIPLVQIPDNERRSEDDLWAEFERQRPLILGALYDAVAVGIKRLPTVKLSTLPRMADFARWGSAACPDLKTKSGQIVRFIDAYAGNREDTVESVLEADPVAVAIRRFMADREEWQGIATELLVHLNGVVGEKAGAAKDWPKDGTRLSSRLTRVATHLRVIGINVRRDRRRATGRRFTIRRELPDREGKIASPASPASQDNTTNGLGGDTMTFANPRPAPPASRPPSQCNPLTNPKIDASDAGDAVFHTRSGSPSNDGIPDFLRRCDHCGQPSRTVEPLLPWDWEGRKILLHGRCETPWLESERTRQRFRRRPAGERLGAPAISAGPDDDLGDLT